MKNRRVPNKDRPFKLKVEDRLGPWFQPDLPHDAGPLSWVTITFQSPERRPERP
jgi:hypothetical protein